MISTPLRIASILGWSNSGKTTLVADLVAECRRRGLRCGAAKCSRHAGNFGDEDKDSGRFREAGAVPVAYIGVGPPKTTAIYLPTPDSPDRAWLEGVFAGVDLLLVEGLEVEGSLRILVEAEGSAGKRSLDEVDLLISGDQARRALFREKRAFRHEEAGAILEALEELWTGK